MTTGIAIARKLYLIAAAIGVCSAAAAAPPAKLSGDSLVDALRRGGYVIVMRHAHSPRQAPAAADAKPGNRKLERQLDDAGRNAARAMGGAIRELGIPVNEVWSSPAFRAVETVRYLGLGAPHTFPELGTEGMDAKVQPQRAQWLRENAAQKMPRGMVRIIVTHQPNIAAAFGDEASDMQDGEALIFKPDGKTAVLVARVRMDEWPQLAAHWKPAYVSG